MNPSQTALLEMLKQPTVCMLAPSFPIDFKFPQIICALRELGFDKITELTYGAHIVNYWYADYIKNHPDQKYYITTPCPTCLALIKSRYRELMEYLVPHVSPMVAMAKIVKKNFPDRKIVFISPCLAKRNMEAPKYKDVIDLVITFKELAEVLAEKGITANEPDEKGCQFDSFYDEATKIYPISGGLAKSAQLKTFFKEEEILIADEIKNLIPMLNDIKAGTSQYRFFDILNCPGGCIGGPDLANKTLSVEEKTKRILDYQKQVEKAPTSTENVENNNDLDFKASF